MLSMCIHEVSLVSCAAAVFSHVTTVPDDEKEGESNPASRAHFVSGTFTSVRRTLPIWPKVEKQRSVAHQ